MAGQEAGSAPEEPGNFSPLPPQRVQWHITGSLEGGMCSPTHAHVQIKVLFIPISPTSTDEFQAYIRVWSKRYPPPNAKRSVPAELYSLTQGHAGEGNMTVSAGTSWCLLRGTLPDPNVHSSVSIHLPWDYVPCKEFNLSCYLCSLNSVRYARI